MFQSLVKFNAHYVFLLQLFFAGLSVVGLFIVDWTPSSVYIVGFFYFLYGGFINSVVLHRALSHKNFLPQPVVYFGAYLTTWSLVGPPLGYVAIHRTHHMTSDTEKDPHSPLFKSVRQIYLEIFFEKTNPIIIRDLLQNRVLVFLSKYYFLISTTSLLILLFLLGASQFYFVIVLPASLSYLTATSINYFCHRKGSRPHATKDSSTNIWILGWLVFGEGWHNNHHSDPQNFYFGRRWYEVDLGGMVFFLLGKMRMK